MSLTATQQSIVEAPFGPMLVTAGAGSGKTRVLTHRLVHIIKNGIKSERVLALTFTNKAAAEMKHRVEQMLGHACDTFVGTFHSFCARFLRRNISVLGSYTENFSIYSASDTARVIKEVITNNNFGENFKKDTKRILMHISQFKSSGLNLNQYADMIVAERNSDEIVRLISAYEAQLSANNALDFDDLLKKTYEILRTNDEIRTKARARFDYILVDEFQDTDTTQYEIVKILGSGHQNVMCVGDEDQCIYTWRGASIQNITKFLNDFAQVKIYKLEQNFRSSKNIVALANALVAHNTNRLEKVLFSSIPDGDISLVECYNEREEAERAATIIASEVRSGIHKYGDFAILMRINALTRTIEEQFLNYNIPHIVWGGFKFYERMEVKNVISYLRLLVNPRDEVALIDAISTPSRGVGEKTFEKIKDIAMQNGVSPLTVVLNLEKYEISITSKARAGINEFATVISNLQDLYHGFGLIDLASSFISVIGYDKLYKDKNKEEDISRLENIYQLEGAIKNFATDNAGATLAMYLESVSLIADADADAGDDAVIISTVHSAKGLEFKNVIIIGLEDEIFPLARSRNSADEMEEERRLLYVAITRARRRLMLTYCKRRYLRGETVECRPSIFLKEAGFEIKRDRFIDNYNRREFGSYNKNSYSNHGAVQSSYNKNDNNYNSFLAKKSDEIVAKDDTAVKLGIKIGVKVSHAKFGVGEVLDVIDSNIVKIKFDKVGIKMLSLAFATLELC